MQSGTLTRASAAGLVLIVLLLTFSLHAKKVDPPSLTPGEDYVQGELLLTFKPSHMPSSSNVSLSARSFGLNDLDSLLSVRGCSRIHKFLKSYTAARSPSGKRMQRKFLISYDAPTDAQAMREELLRLPYFERVSLNKLIAKEYFGVRKAFPNANTRFDGPGDRQWYFHHPTKDSVDIDAPEAWAIEKGDPDIVVVIHDSGIMLDTTTTNSAWNLHSDFDYYWTAEDTSASEVLNWADLNHTDASGDDDDLLDNVIGYNWGPLDKFQTDPDTLAFWTIPHNWQHGVLTSQCNITEDHGTLVASITVGGFDNGANAPANGDITGIAPDCQIYVIRTDSEVTPIADEIEALLHGAEMGDVMNMSWGFVENPGDDFRDAVNTAANDLDCVMTAAVGNNGLDTLVWWPALYDSILAVGAVDTLNSGGLLHDGGLYAASGYSNYDKNSLIIDLVAPVDNGVPANAPDECECPCEHDEIVRRTALGTSFAAPQVTGVAALVRSRYPTLTAPEVVERLKKSAEYYWDSDTLGAYKYGAGKINAYRAITEWDTVTANTTWDTADTKDGIFYVSGDLVVAQGITLTINKGVTVRIAGSDNESTGNDSSRVEIVVNGTLKTGTGTGSVIFESFADTVGIGDWVGIKFASTSSGNVLDGFVIRHAQVGIENYAFVDVKNSTIDSCEIGIETHADIDIRNSTITQVEDFGIRAISGYALVESDTISYSDLAGISVEQALIKDSYIHNNGTTGIVLDAATDSLVMTNTLVEGNDTGVFKKLGSRVEIDDCVIRNHTDGVVGWTSSDTLLVKNSTIDSSSTSGVLCYASTVTILRNTIVKDNPVGVRGYYNSIPEIRGRSMIKDNAQEGLKCEIGSHAVVESTTIKGNFIGVLADTSSTPQLGRTSGGPSVGRNVIADNDTFEVDNNHLTATIKAEKNYWGASGPDTTKIDGRVDYTPWLHSKPDIEPEIEAVAGYVPNDLEFPGRYHLTYNYPNPFNPTTRLKYDVPAPGGIVQMVIYNIRGQRVTTLLNRSRPAGTYTVTWNGKDDRGQPVASGVYFVRMSAGSFKQIRKIVLLK